MNYKLGTNVNIGNKILLKTGWKKIIATSKTGVETSDGVLDYGMEIYGRKIK